MGPLTTATLRCFGRFRYVPLSQNNRKDKQPVISSQTPAPLTLFTKLPLTVPVSCISDDFRGHSLSAKVNRVQGSCNVTNLRISWLPVSCISDDFRGHSLLTLGYHGTAKL